jgi:hypothetical protein
MEKKIISLNLFSACTAFHVFQRINRELRACIPGEDIDYKTIKISFSFRWLDPILNGLPFLHLG